MGPGGRGPDRSGHRTSPCSHAHAASSTRLRNRYRHLDIETLTPLDSQDERAPIGWNVHDPEPAARGCVALLSDWFPATTATIVHVDGGVHAMGQ